MGEEKKDNSDVEDLEINPSGGNSFKEIVMSQLRKVTQLANVEWHGGYYTSTTTKSSQEKEIYIQDTREVFSNGVYILTLLLKPKFDTEMNTALTNFNAKLKKRQDEFIKKSKPDEEVILGEIFYKEEEDKILLETYRNKKLRLHLALFSEISKQLARLKYMELGGGTY